jgi:peptidyl-tRNA hydrolase, PTH1 family
MIPLGNLRIRLKGSSGGHNGLDSILAAIGTQELPRLRVGIGPVPENDDPADYVLKTFHVGERAQVSEMVGQAADAVRVILTDGVDRAMNRFNKKGVVS